MDLMAPIGPYLAGSLIGYATGVAISVLLLVLTVRAAKLAGTATANILCAVCSLIWNFGGLAHSIALTLGVPKESQPALILLALQFTPAAAWPILVLAIWSPLATRRWQKIGSQALHALAAMNATALVILFWWGAFSGVFLVDHIKLAVFTSYNGSILLILGIILFRERLASRSIWLSSTAILAGGLGATIASFLSVRFQSNESLCKVLSLASEQLPLLIILGVFFLFARFRYSDLFIRYSFRILVAAFISVAFILLIRAPLISYLAGHTAFPGATRVFIETLIAAAALLSFALLDQRVASFVDQWIFRAPDYRDLNRLLAEKLAQPHIESDVAEAVEGFVRNALELNDVRVIALEKLPALEWPAELHDGEAAELNDGDPLRGRLGLPNLELLIPVRSAGRLGHVLAVSPGPAHRSLVTHEVNYLRTVAAQFGDRLDSLRAEQAMVERQSREATLLQQISQAELRALRAQVNPHFLFNSLNSIANLIITNPERAEAMALRLAKVFRYVLANSSRSLISLREEIEFLQTYLQIEEARFGNRLVVGINIDPVVAMEPIPSLILQPIVENALKHGLAPKLGQGHLWISARAQEDQLCLQVEDDGVGPMPEMLPKANRGNSSSRQPSADKRPAGVGLANVAQRLITLYQDRGRMSLEARETGGTRVTLLLPRRNGVAGS